MAKPRKAPGTNTSKPAFSNGIAYALFTVLILVIYGASFRYGFTLDDELFIGNNPVVKQGIGGIPEAFSQGSMTHFKGSNFQIYRPTVISAFCLQYGLFRLNPGSYHFINVLLYILLSVVMLRVLRRLLPQLHPGWPVLIVLLYIVHPIHTEVVASIKSQDELFAALFNLAALGFFLRALSGTSSERRDLGLSTLCFLFALFAKESSAAFLAVFPLAGIVVLRSPLKHVARASLPLLAAVLVFVLARQAAIGDVFQENETTILENVLYGTDTPSERWATTFGIAWLYLKMMLWPHPLSWDYSFSQIQPMSWSDTQPWLALCGFLILLVLAGMWLKRAPASGFFLLFFCGLIVPTANVFFYNGTTFADRFLFLPSLGFIAAAVLLAQRSLASNDQQPPQALGMPVIGTLAIVLLLCTGASMSRASDWTDDFAVFSSGVAHAPMSSRTQAGLGTLYMNRAEAERDPAQRRKYVDSAVTHLEESIRLLPGNTNALFKVGLIYSMTGETNKAIDRYRRSISSRPDYVMALNNLGALYASLGLSDSAYVCFKQSYLVDSSNGMTLTNLCIVSNLLGKRDEALKVAEYAERIGQGNEKTRGVRDVILQSTAR
ncbi:MAG: hypothetical protein ACK5CT_06470 [Bacteroidota bacterium]|jgi:tetratricopeptide (TPR) repeat protein